MAGWARCPGAEQQEEISATVQFLTAVHGHAPVDWVMCYPYGSYNRVTLELLQQSGCALGLTCAVELVEELSRPLEIARLDTTDLPCSGTADRCQWN